jgi:hypothetical protein
MAKRVLEVIECDVCGQEGDRYIVIYPGEGQLILDRCDRHNGKLIALKKESGQWMGRDQRRTAFKVSDPEKLLREHKGK